MSFNKMTTLFKLILVLSTAHSRLVIADTTPQGNETGNRDLPLSTATILKVVNEEKTYKIDKKVEGCPEFVQLIKNPEKSSDKNLKFSMAGYDKSDGVFSLQRSHFWSEHSYFDYDIVKKEGKLKDKESGCSFILGIGCNSRYQITNKDSIVFEGSAKVVSLAMIAFSNYSIKFDIANDKISYLFEANGVEDTLCTYSAAPGFDKEIKSYHAEVQKKHDDYVNDTKRESGKNIAPETESSGAASRATSSK